MAMIVYKNRAVNLKAEMEDGQIQPWVRGRTGHTPINLPSL